MDVTAKVLRIVETANTSEKVRRMMKGWNRTVRISIDNTTHEITIAEGQATLRTNPLGKADLSFTFNEETFDALMAEKITPFAAKIQGKIKSSGNIMDILRFASILSASIKQLRSSAIQQKGINDES